MNQTTIRKVQKYEFLERIAQVQYQARKRPDELRFVPCVMSHRGEMGPDFIQLIESIAVRMKSIAKQPHYFDGLSPPQASAQMRTLIKDRLAAAMAKGWGKQLFCAGFNDYALLR